MSNMDVVFVKRSDPYLSEYVNNADMVVNLSADRSYMDAMTSPGVDLFGVDGAASVVLQNAISSRVGGDAACV